MDQLSDEQLLSAVLAVPIGRRRRRRFYACRGDRPFKPWLYAIATNLEDAYLLVTGTQPATAA